MVWRPAVWDRACSGMWLLDVSYRVVAWCVAMWCIAVWCAVHRRPGDVRKERKQGERGADIPVLVLAHRCLKEVGGVSMRVCCLQRTRNCE